MSDASGRDADPKQPWSADPDAWRDGAHPEGRSAHPWPQLAAGPAYWMWLERLEEERGIVG